MMSLSIAFIKFSKATNKVVGLVKLKKYDGKNIVTFKISKNKNIFLLQRHKYDESVSFFIAKLVAQKQNLLLKHDESVSFFIAKLVAQ